MLERGVFWLAAGAGGGVHIETFGGLNGTEEAVALTKVEAEEEGWKALNEWTRGAISAASGS